MTEQRSGRALQWFGFTGFDRQSTSIKMMLVITMALLPLGIIALLASLQSASSAERRRHDNLVATLQDGARRLGSALALDGTVLSSALNAVHEGADPDAVCSRVKAIFLTRVSVRPFALFTEGGTPLCASSGFTAKRPATGLGDGSAEAIVSDDGLDLVVPDRSSDGVALTRYSPDVMERLIYSATTDPSASLFLDAPERSVAILSSASPVFDPLSLTADVGQDHLALRLTAPKLPFGAAEALLAFLPFLMWGSAAAIGFVVVDRALIRPLAALRAGVAAYARGEPFPDLAARTPAQEIGELAETFMVFARTQDGNQRDLADALARQTELTREVHHRVKNNLQVIASLISLHARATDSPDARDAYAAIQRRVDALAVVHRNHYAERDAMTGIDLRPILSELTTSLRNSFADPVPAAITIHSPSLRVGQDTGVAIAFLLTELGELAFSVDSAQSVVVDVHEADPQRATLSITSLALRPGETIEQLLAHRYTRVINGLARQLRTAIDTDPETGCYEFVIPIIAVPKKID